ncbi:hypothetical protein TrRE_jg9522 [Triparma retinervis]|uniref:Dynein light chain n=1 Tax=Triparma retinervis TaxID=2557542 RepID=A0A9W7DVG6_9STRA|nr:hypothetical protein TrRE_jg9522 [Triparma retinervis]
MMEDFANTVLESAIVSTLEGHNYDASNVPKQVASMNKFILENMANACGNFKYVSSVIIMSNDTETRQPPQSVVNFSACWNSDSDHLVDVTWRSDAMTCVASVIGVLL